MPVYRAMSSEEGTTVETALSTSGAISRYQAEDLPDQIKARSHAGSPKAVSERSELQDSDYVTIIDPATGARFETDWASAKATGLDAYVSIPEQGRRAAQDLPRGELNEAGRKALEQEAGKRQQAEPLYTPDPNASLLVDTIAMHGDFSQQEVEGFVSDFISNDGADEELVGFLGSRGLDPDSLDGLVGNVWTATQSQAANELSEEDYEFIGWAADHNPEVRKLAMYHGWKAASGKATMSWPQFAQLVRRKMGAA